MVFVTGSPGLSSTLLLALNALTHVAPYLHGLASVKHGSTSGATTTSVGGVTIETPVEDEDDGDAPDEDEASVPDDDDDDDDADAAPVEDDDEEDDDDDDGCEHPSDTQIFAPVSPLVHVLLEHGVH